jgi:hypothetical protein
MRQRKPLGEGNTYADEVMRAYDRQAKPAKIWWDPATTPVLLEVLFAQGHTYKHLAELLGAPNAQVVFLRAKEMGLPGKYPRAESAVTARKATLAAKAAAAKAAAPVGWPKHKRCLRCRDGFMSEGPHNHICDPCKTANRRGMF